METGKCPVCGDDVFHRTTAPEGKFTLHKMGDDDIVCFNVEGKQLEVYIHNNE